ncbi:MAG: hypothetical protein CK425_03045 [Parachlamydia sp.]|nr:MAG: hypothetical protein CK425_03045 [Parachlamydia sp.]
MSAEILYDFPEAAGLLFMLILIIGGFASLHYYRSSITQSFSLVNQDVMLARDPASVWIKGVLLSLVWMGAVIALMQPKGNSHYSKEVVTALYQDDFAPINQIQLLLDASASMQVADVRQKQARFDYAKEVIDELIRVWDGKNVSFWAFTEIATRLSPATMDALFLRLMVRDVQINEGNATGTKLLSAVEAIETEIAKIPADKHLTTLLFSDGEDTSEGSMEEKQNALKNKLAQLSEKYKNRLTIYTIGIGSAEGGQIPHLLYRGQTVESKREDRLLELISQVGGDYLLAENSSSVAFARLIVEKINKTEAKDWSETSAASPHEEKQNPLIYTAYYQYPLGFALMFLLLEIFFPMCARSKEKPGT